MAARRAFHFGSEGSRRRHHAELFRGQGRRAELLLYSPARSASPRKDRRHRCRSTCPRPRPHLASPTPLPRRPSCGRPQQRASRDHAAHRGLACLALAGGTFWPPAHAQGRCRREHGPQGGTFLCLSQIPKDVLNLRQRNLQVVGDLLRQHVRLRQIRGVLQALIPQPREIQAHLVPCCPKTPAHGSSDGSPIPAPAWKTSRTTGILCAR